MTRMQTGPGPGPVAVERTRFRWRTAMAAILLTAAFPLTAGPPVQARPSPGDYRIVNGRVDPGTYSGWRLFHTACHGCHGVGAVGTDLAPSLVERVGHLTPRAFATKVLTSYRIVPPLEGAASDDAAALREAAIEEIMRRERGAGPRVVMPAWDGDPRVEPHVLDLYAYLSARADGQLGPGKPLRMGNERARAKP
jgi:hypothetical protein